jgi:predicted nucleic acid-binding protein
VDAFDTDVLIYAAVPGHPLGRRVRALLPERQDAAAAAAVPAGVGSVLLVPELLTKPTRIGAADEVAALTGLLSRLELVPVDEANAGLAVALGAAYGLGTADAIHLAAAVGVGADRFITNNARDFPKSIAEIDVTYPADLPDPG